MLILHDIRGKKANKIRWETLRLLDWEKDQEVITEICNIDNPLYFSSREPQKIITEIKYDIELDKKIRIISENKEA